MEGPARWTRLGWQGISFDVPEDWCPGRLEGDYADGYLRVEDETRIRLEVRWETAGRRIPAASQLVDKYLKETRRKTRRKDAEPTTDRGRAVPELQDVDHEAFTWRGGFNAHSLLLVAPGSRIVHLRIFFEDGQEQRGLARRIFASVRAAPRDGLDEWCLFGLRFELPSWWRLEQSALRTGCLQLVFKHRSDELEVVRVSLAELTLRKACLAKWFEGFFAKALRRCRYELSEAAYHAHPAAHCRGVVRPGVPLLGLVRPRRHVTALAWHCAEADKLFAIRAVTTAPGDAQVERCADSIVCH